MYGIYVQYARRTSVAMFECPTAVSTRYFAFTVPDWPIGWHSALAWQIRDDKEIPYEELQAAGAGTRKPLYRDAFMGMSGIRSVGGGAAYIFRFECYRAKTRGTAINKDINTDAHYNTHLGDSVCGLC